MRFVLGWTTAFGTIFLRAGTRRCCFSLDLTPTIDGLDGASRRSERIGDIVVIVAVAADFRGRSDGTVEGLETALVSTPLVDPLGLSCAAIDEFVVSCMTTIITAQTEPVRYRRVITMRSRQAML